MSIEISRTLKQTLEDYKVQNGLKTIEDMVIKFIDEHPPLQHNATTHKLFTVVFNVSMSTDPALFYNAIPVVAKQFNIDPERCKRFKGVLLNLHRVADASQANAVLGVIAQLPLPYCDKDEFDPFTRYCTHLLSVGKDNPPRTHF